MKVYLKTFPKGHLVSSKERGQLVEAWKTKNISLVDSPDDADAIIVKAFSTTWDEVRKYAVKPVIVISFGINWGAHYNLESENKKYVDLIQNADGIVYMSEFARDLSNNYFKNFLHKQQPQVPSTVIYNAQNVDLILKHKSAKHEFHIATTSIWRDWKRLHDMIACVEQWNREERKPKITLHVAGTKGKDTEWVKYLGMMDSFPHYHDMHAYMHLALMETFGNAVAEALAMGVPCVVTNFGATSELVKDAGVVIHNDPIEYIDFTERPTMYGDVPKIAYSKFSTAMHEIISRNEFYEDNAKRRSNVFSRRYVGDQWNTFLRQFNKY